MPNYNSLNRPKSRRNSYRRRIQ